jgi:amino acid adenylation domain-containing protein/non-ribosomal peptide synthase protein (TIGR01720 family)
VQIHHRGLVNTITTTGRLFSLNSNSRVAQVASFTFDASVAEIFGALTTGASLHLVNASSLLTASEFRNLLLDQQINFIGLSPSLLNVLEKDEFPQLQTIAVGGETCSLQTAAKWSKGRKFFNAYAPTESTIFSTIFECSEKYGEVVPVGKPVANAQVYILDREMQPLPAGVPGELHIAGVGLARGYLNRPELTAERFVPNPFTSANGERMYKTGDLARWQADGNIEFLGRIDFQVKIRGFRIELGEIETVLEQHEDVTQAVVTVREERPGDQRLVAYVCLKERRQRTERELKAFLSDKLPDYMVPAAVVELEAFPLTSNGKVDRKALPAPELLKEDTGEHYVAPRTPTEEVLEMIWSEVLGLQRVSIYDNFFELGGHSLLATQILSRLRQTWNINLPLKSLFEDPTIAGLGRAIDHYGQAREAGAATIVHTSRERELPLSFAQQRLWFLEQLEEGKSGYNLSTAVRLKGTLNIPALERSLDRVVERHEALRTSFPAIDGRAVQVIHEPAKVGLELIDLSKAEPSEERINALLQESANAVFDLSQGPLFRGLLLRLGEEDHLLQLTLHHIVSDGWSMGVLVRETSSLYNAFAQDTEVELEPLTIQYADYAAWQRDWLQREVLESQMSYWRSQLADAKVPQLPTDYARGKSLSHRGAAETRMISCDLKEGLARLGRQENFTLFMLLLGAFQILLWRYTGEKDVVVGIPIANRNRQEIENLIGFFVNTLVMRTRLKADESLLELFRQVREAALAGYAHQDLPFETLVDELQPQRELTQTPLFQVMFVHQNTPMQQMALHQLTASAVEYENATAQFDLMVFVSESNEGLKVTAQYKRDLFAAETIQRLLGHYEQMLQGLSTGLNQKVHSLPYFNEIERAQVIQGWNQLLAPVEAKACLQQLFEEQVDRTPEAVALRHNGQELTYRQLNERSNQLARHLRRLGVKPEFPVGICLERSLDILIGILAVLKAGGAYVPLDPNYPAERLSYTLQDSGAQVLLIQEKLAALLPSYSGTVVKLDAQWLEIGRESQENLERTSLPEHLAYVIYTSGSTGRPKGVAIRHSSAVALVRWAHRVFSLPELAQVLASTSICFDLSIFEMFVPLTCGGAVVMALNALELPRLPEAGQVTLVNTVPSAMAELVRSRAIPDSVRTVNLAGEALSLELVNGVYTTSRVERVFNLYGPTEDTTYSTSACQPRRAASVTIGGPIANTQAFVLDEWMDPVAGAIVGDLYLAGDGLARGYLNNPERTAESFVANPFSAEPGARMYKTGDLARWRADGTLEFFGRKDNQVKLRGFRIEPGEIESVLGKHPDVKQCAVAVRDRAAGDKQLVAFVVRTQKQESSHNDLRAYLSKRLPEHMVPALFVSVDTLRLTPNGKIDYKSLTVPERLDSETAGTADVPRTREEAILTEIWANVLGIESLGIHENFFQLGGDSILSIQIVARANRAGLRVTPRQIFENQTIAELASVARRSAAIQAEQGLVSGSVPLTAVQQWFFEQDLQDPHHFNQAVMLATRQKLDPDVLEKTVAGLIQHHDALRMRFSRDDEGQWRQQNSPQEAGMRVVVRVDLSKLSNHHQTSELERAADEWQASLNLQGGPLVRFVLFDLGPDTPQRLLIVVHHLVVDGVSWRILLEDLESNYREQLRTGSWQFGKKTTSFQQWSRWLQERYAQSPQVSQELDYWRNVVAGRAASLPLDFVRGENTVGSADSVQLNLGEEQTQALIRSAAQAYRMQVPEVLLAALLCTLSDWSSEPSLLLEMEGHGREDVSDQLDLTRTVGWFTTMFPLRLGTTLNGEPGQVLKCVKEQVRNVPQKGLGYSLLRYLHGNQQVREALQPRKPVEISFNYLGHLDQVLDPQGIFTGAAESGGTTQSPLQRRNHIIDITASVQQHELQVQLFYSRNLHERSTMERIGQELLGNLNRLVAHCGSVTTAEYTPSDFPWVRLDQRALDELLHGGEAIEHIYSLTPMQEGMLFHTLAAEKAGVYFEQLTCVLEGDLQVDAFAQAWQTAVDHHEILRSRFAWGVSEQIVRVVGKKTRIDLERQDWRSVPEGQREAQLHDYLREDLARGFDVAHAPLMRLALIHVENKKYWLVWDFHHLLLDGWSLPIVLKDVFAAYRALCNGSELKLEQPSPYHAYARWLRKQDLRKAEEFWRERLKGFHSPIRLGVEKIGPKTEMGPGDEDLYLSEQSSQKLYNLARAHHLTLNTLVQGMWALLLSRYSGASDLIFGATVSGRPGEVEGIERQVGVFINTLPVRVHVNEEQELIPWLQRIQQSQVEQRQYEYTSLADIQRWSELPGSIPLFSTIVVFENTPVEAALEQEIADTGLQAASLLRREQTNYPIEIMVTPGKRLMLRMIYAKNEYDGEIALRILKHLRDLLESVAQNANIALSHLTFAAPELPVLSRTVKDAVPLSPHQDRLWFIDRFETGTVYDSAPVYHNIPLGLILPRTVNALVLEQAINEVIERHAALQIRILDHDGQAVQVTQNSSIKLKIVDQEGEDTVSHELATEWILKESRVPFALNCESPIRATLFRSSSGESLLVIVVHHIAADRASMRIVASELAEIYCAKAEGRTPSLNECKFNFLDYAHWYHGIPEHTWTSGSLYWKRQLGGGTVNLELPTRRQRHAIHEFESARHEFAISSPLLEAVQSVSRNGSSGDMQVLLTAFYALLHVYSGQEGFFIGLTSTSRHKAETETLVGPLSNLLAFRCNSIGSTFSALLGSISKTLDEAYRFQEMPFELVTQQLKLPKDMSRTVLFDVLFEYDDEPVPSLPFDGGQARWIETNLGYGKYDLNLYLRPSAGGLAGTIVYNDKLYDRNAIERMARHYQVLLQAMSSNPQQPIREVELLDEEEKKQQLVLCNSTQSDYPHSATIHRLFEEQATLGPDNVAVKYGDEQLTYFELNRRANQLAHHLINQGVVSGTLVGICLNRSLEMVVAIFAVLKAGGAYLPLDPSYPDERLAFMIEDGRVAHLIAGGGLVDKFAGRGIPWLTSIERDQEAISRQRIENPAVPVGPRDLAYCIYTSGSTGQPNGVLVEHMNVVRLLKNANFQFSFTERDVWTFFHSYAFDFSVWEIFGTLAYGGTIVVVPSDFTRDAGAFLDLLCREKVSVLSQTPAAFYNLAAQAVVTHQPELALRYVVFGGEALQPAQLGDFRKMYPAVKLINMYGITETTVHVTFREIDQLDIDKNTSNIGRPIPTLTTYVLSPNIGLLPVGVIGELCVGGDGVTRGYMNRPQLTATRFVADPFSDVPGSRLYRSGDLARYGEDGNLEYMGRIDHQVKIRGFRIELGEIETALRAHPGVERALVLARQDASGEKQLVAYLVRTGKDSVSPKELRMYLAEVLPAYMLPAHFVYVEKFPLTANGKVDRKALPEPHITSDESQALYAPPRTPTEEMLCEVWADVLKLPRVGIHESFFELGGHSLLAMQLISRIRKIWQSELELRCLFENPTVAGLAAVITQRQHGNTLPAIEPAGRERPFPLSFAQQRLWFLEQLAPGHSAFNMATAVRLEGKLDSAAFEKSLVEVVRRHDSLRTRFIERDGIGLQEVLPAIPFTAWFEGIDLQPLGDAAAVQVEKLARAAAETPFDLQNGPLLRVKLLQLAPEEHVLQLTMHHIIGDGWSMGVLVREFALLYEAYRKEERSPLPELKVQYPDYAVWQGSGWKTKQWRST